MQEKLGNPAVVGLAGFGGTTLLLQFHNLGLCGIGPIIWTAVFFGGLAQFLAGFKEFQLGNNFGFVAFSGFGAFWMALAGILASAHYGILDIDGTDVGWFLVLYTIFTFILFLAAMRQNGALAFLFLTLLAGFVFLDISHLGGPEVFTQIAAYDLIICAITAFYIMAHIIFKDLDVDLPLGKAWIEK